MGSAVMLGLFVQKQFILKEKPLPMICSTFLYTKYGILAMFWKRVYDVHKLGLHDLDQIYVNLILPLRSSSIHNKSK